MDGGVRIECLPLPVRIPLFFHITLTSSLVRRALALRPEVIHLFKPKGYTGLAHWMLIALRRWGRDIPRLVLDTDDWEQAWNPVAGYPPWQRYLFAWQELWGLRHADAVTLASLKLPELVMAAGVPHARIFYVPNGITPASASALLDSSTTLSSIGGHHGRSEVRLRHRLGEGPVVLLYTRFAEFGLGRLVDLIARLAERVPAARWLIVGQGFAGEEQTLFLQLKAATLDQYVVFVGWVPIHNLPDYFAAADVAAFPFDDTPINWARCSVKLTDLLAAGLPVVADAVGQNEVYILNEETGWLVAPGNTDAFVTALVRLLGDSELRRRLGTAARQRMLQHFTWPALVGAVEEAYRCG
jgi:glycosyltransferase involved in cell wall biosynthesis